MHWQSVSVSWYSKFWLMCTTHSDFEWISLKFLPKMKRPVILIKIRWSEIYSHFWTIVFWFCFPSSSISVVFSEICQPFALAIFVSSFGSIEAVNDANQFSSMWNLNESFVHFRFKLRFILLLCLFWLNDVQWTWHRCNNWFWSSDQGNTFASDWFCVSSEHGQQQCLAIFSWFNFSNIMS